MSTIVDAMKSELARLKAEHERWDAEYQAAEAELRKRLAPFHSHHAEIRRLTEALNILEAG